MIFADVLHLRLDNLDSNCLSYKLHRNHVPV
uniref:Uncharacterized protein n=1 Tax=Arundo donax TaxID=35708 RepID=A0A0A8Z359_ARUDO